MWLTAWNKKGHLPNPVWSNQTPWWHARDSWNETLVLDLKLLHPLRASYTRETGFSLCSSSRPNVSRLGPIWWSPLWLCLRIPEQLEGRIGATPSMTRDPLAPTLAWEGSRHPLPLSHVGAPRLQSLEILQLGLATGPSTSTFVKFSPEPLEIEDVRTRRWPESGNSVLAPWGQLFWLKAIFAQVLFAQGGEQASFVARFFCCPGEPHAVRAGDRHTQW